MDQILAAAALELAPDENRPPRLVCDNPDITTVEVSPSPESAHKARHEEIAFFKPG